MTVVHQLLSSPREEVEGVEVEWGLRRSLWVQRRPAVVDLPSWEGCLLVECPS